MLHHAWYGADPWTRTSIVEVYGGSVSVTLSVHQEGSATQEVLVPEGNR